MDDPNIWQPGHRENLWSLLNKNWHTYGEVQTMTDTIDDCSLHTPLDLWTILDSERYYLDFS